MSSEIAFDQFSVGDHVVFSRRFSASDFASFAGLSGDENPLHHDTGYARGSGFDRPIVPLHLALAPLSKIAGMIFPGEPSLYLGHEVRALLPIPYDEEITYSARVTAVSGAQRVLTLQVLALTGARVLFQTIMRVQARAERWSTPPAESIRRGAGTALVTGAAGEIGAAVARRLARAGYSLLLHVRKKEEAACEGLVAGLGASSYRFVEADLGREEDRAELADAVGRCEDLSLVVHTASPPVEAPLAALIDVNVTALHEIAQAALPALLRRQDGAVIALGTRAVEVHPEGWQDYVAAKAAAASLLDGFHRWHAPYGVRGLVLALGYVRTAYSRKYLPADEPALLPEEAAEEVIRLVTKPGSDSYHSVDVRGRTAGRFGFLAAGDAGGQPRAPEEAPSRRPVGQETLVSSSAGETEEALEAVLRRSLRLSAEERLDNASLGVTPGWDSLRHIELLLDIEHTLGVRFTSKEIDHTKQYRDLAELCRKKLSSGGAGSSLPRAA
jgi:NAD(P)-dependent dehydrogenase (short-subunit alcohol dehydrogenase family)/acyl dehydratase/acyl carrier protein